MQKHFKILFVILAAQQNFLAEKAFLMGNLKRYISTTEGRRKLKSGEASLQICRNF